MPGDPQSGDKVLTCVDCSVQFTFSARDQAFYKERGYQEPRRCKACRDKRKTGQVPGGPHAGDSSGETKAVSGESAAAGAAPARPQFKVNCSGCGVETTVPFKPDPNRPVYCRACYLARRKSGQAQ
jgi:CxxC-x17-CxxC domain-containing protein